MSLHTVPPPMEALEKWLEAYGTVQAADRYGHLLLQQIGSCDDDLVASLRPYFESAHLDAREYFHHQLGIDLHPDGGPEMDVRYPTCLPDIAKRGLFGEVMAGLVVEAYQSELVGGHAWRVPIFLFRNHDDVENYLWVLKEDPSRKRQVYGRHGTDFVGIALDVKGAIERMIVGECKWRKTLTDSVVDAVMLGEKVKDAKTGKLEHNSKGVWYQLNRDKGIPWGLRQMQRLLEVRDPIGHASTIYSIDQAVLTKVCPERTDMILLVGDGAKKREDLDCLIGWDAVPKEYTAGKDLQVVEVILNGGDWLVGSLYSSLWEDA